NIGYDHFYIHGMEYPVVSDFDFSLGVPRPRDEAHLWAVKAFYATTRNMMLLTTGELDQGSLPSALAANLYATRRLVNVPFMLREDCLAVAEAQRTHKLSFVGSVQDHNHERMLFLRASALEFGSALTKQAEGFLWSVNTAKLFLRALVPQGFGGTATHVLNNSRRERLALQRRNLKNLYRRTSICVVAPGDAPALGQRLSDILEAGCIPAVLVGPGSQPVLPLQGIVRWEEFAIIVRLGDDVAGARWAIRRILKTSTAEASAANDPEYTRPDM
ncbi:bPT2, partial [Symbiodinium sp. CCMP2456]